MAQFQTNYGYFSDDGREYVITRADTPMSWINVISNGDYGMTLSQADIAYSLGHHASSGVSSSNKFGHSEYGIWT